MHGAKKNIPLKIAALALSVLAPFIATISYFPLWIDKGAEFAISGISLCIMLVCALPIFKMVKRTLRPPSAPLIWLMIFILFFALSKIAEDITVIALIGFISNLIGAVLFKIADQNTEKKQNEKQT